MKVLDFKISQADNCRNVHQSKVNREAPGHVQILMYAIASGVLTLAAAVGLFQLEYKLTRISYLGMWSL